MFKTELLTTGENCQQHNFCFSRARIMAHPTQGNRRSFKRVTRNSKELQMQRLIRDGYLQILTDSMTNYFYRDMKRYSHYTVKRKKKKLLRKQHVNYTHVCLAVVLRACTSGDKCPRRTRGKPDSSKHV